MELLGEENLLVALGSAAFLLSALTQLTKKIGVLQRIPTDLQVLVLALLLGLGLLARAGLPPHWQDLVACLVFALLAAFIAIYGWQTFFALWQRFLPPQAGGAAEAEDD